MESMTLFLNEMDEEKLQDVTNKIYKLNNILEKSFGIGGLTMRIDSIDGLRYLYMAYDENEIERKHKRKAGRRRDMTIFIKHKVSPQEARERMQNGEKAEDIAKEIGISRAYFFRKLKEAEENNYPYIGWTSDDYAIEEDFI